LQAFTNLGSFEKKYIQEPVADKERSWLGYSQEPPQFLPIAKSVKKCNV